MNPSSSAVACSSKSNERQNRLRIAKPQARLMAPPNGSVHDELHAARLVEKSLENDAPARRQQADRFLFGHEVRDGLPQPPRPSSRSPR